MGIKFCKDNNLNNFFETSAKNGYNINNLFLEAAKVLYEQNYIKNEEKQNKSKSTDIIIIEENNKVQQTCNLSCC